MPVPNWRLVLQFNPGDCGQIQFRSRRRHPSGTTMSHRPLFFRQQRLSWPGLSTNGNDIYCGSPGAITVTKCLQTDAELAVAQSQFFGQSV